ncbi:hypothetical protein [Flavobacterium sp. 1355]|jgi:hypothetical protein|uniref:hypothetical protein n=1 Tax=Flavobacterium sp. 1355 TaxID=2806571 RepID=UPI001AE845C0|nr:hypothetical protein [Flavobacterium sp. 1355]MBP1221656.1 hypothetical protein [Flavobacterium sp. 1355]
MKHFIILSAFALLSTTLFSCTADEFETAETKTEIKKDSIPVQADAPPDGPGDQPIIITPPK